MFLGFLLLSIVVGLTLLPIFRAQFWPLNHEFNSFFLRTMIYAEHLKQGDFLPIWSVADNNGMGSPQPLLYHKLFYLISGGLFAISNYLKLSLVVSIILFLLFGAAGMYFLCRSAGIDGFSSLCGAVILVVSNYTITNWLVRGAMAEFSAAMLIPTALGAYILMLKDKTIHKSKIGVLLGLSMAMIFIAHSVLAFYLGLFLVFTTAVIVLIHRNLLNLDFFYALVIQVFVFFIVIGPLIICIKIVASQYDMSRIIPAWYLPTNQFKPLVRYIYDGYWRWGLDWRGYTVQLDLFVLLLLSFGCLAHIIRIIRLTHKRHKLKLKISVSTTAITLLLILGLAFQTKLAGSFYEKFPDAKYIQFPWRLLGVITPLLIVLALISVESVRFKRLLVLAITLLSVMFSGFWHPLHYGELSPNISLDKLRFSAFGEYVPAVVKPEGYNVDAIYRDIEILGCDLKKIKDNKLTYEPLTVTYRLQCLSNAFIPLPVYASAYHRIVIYDYSSKALLSKLGCRTHLGYPGLCSLNVNAGDWLVEIRYPTIVRIISYYLKMGD
jgi:hypothetical protein